MTPLLLLTFLALQGAESWRSALVAEDYRGAWNAAEALRDPVGRARARAEIRYQAGDPAGALAAAEDGLGLAPRELELLFYASGAALWLQEAELARGHVTSLQEALRSAELAPEARAAWLRTVQDHAQRAATLAANEAARNRAVGVARAVSLLGLGGALAALLLVARGQGRSSRPVS